MTQPALRVSVIIPTYNRADYLTLAVNSVLAQSYPVFEIVVIDDGSVDNTRDVVRSAGNKVRLYEQDHQGVAAARNRGLDEAHGDVIAWLDDDDLWEPGFLTHTVPLLASDPTLDGVYTGMVHIDAAGNQLSQSSTKTVPAQQLFSALLEEDFVLTPTVVVRKHCFDEVGKFDTQFRICEDYDMWLRLARRFTLRGVPQPLVKVRVHGGNTLRDTSALEHYRLQIVNKHFGATDGDPAAWPIDKRRAHAFALREVALVEIQTGHTERGWKYLQRAAVAWSGLLDGPRTFYELALGDQPRGQRGQLDRTHLQRSGADMLQRLECLFDETGERLRAVRPAAFGSAYLALGMLFDQAGDWSAARHCLWNALRTNPRLAADRSVLRRWLKLAIGPQLVGKLRRLRNP